MNYNQVIATLLLALFVVIGYNVVIGGPSPVTIIKEVATGNNLGAASSPDISSPYFSVGGVREWFYQMDLKPASVTVCSFLSPAATTTLRAVTARFDSIAAYATVWQWGVGTVSTATTTNLTTPYSIAANAQGALVATTTVTSLVDGIVAPRTYVNLNVATGTVSSVFAPSGKCKITFREI